MITAKFSRRTHVPFGYIAMEFARLEFTGKQDVAKLLNNLCFEIEYKKSHEYELKINKLSERKSKIQEELNEWQKEVEGFKKEHLFWMLKKEYREELNILKNECGELSAKFYDLSRAIKQLEDNKYYSAFELSYKFKKLLKELGFVCKYSNISKGGACREIYESTCSDEELKSIAEKKLSEFKEKQAKKHKEILERYDDSKIVDSPENFYM